MQLSTASVSQICTDFSKLGVWRLGGNSEVEYSNSSKARGHFSVLLPYSVFSLRELASFWPCCLHPHPPCSVLLENSGTHNKEMTIDSSDECRKVISSKHFAQLPEKKGKLVFDQSEQDLLNIAHIFHFLRSFVLRNIGICNSEVTLTEHEIPKHMGFSPS